MDPKQIPGLSAFRVFDVLDQTVVVGGLFLISLLHQPILVACS